MFSKSACDQLLITFCLFRLSLPLVTKWDKTHREPEVFHRFDDKKTCALHDASHVHDLPRLLCVIEQNGVSDWNTFCLSNFIRSSKYQIILKHEIN